MKEPLRAPFIFLLILIAATAVLSILNLLYTWGMYDSAGRGFDLAYIAQRAPRSVFEVLIPSVVLSIVLLGFRLARRPFSRFLGLLIVLGVSYIVLVNGMIWFRALSGKSQPAQETPRQYLQTATFMRVGGTMLSVSGIKGTALQGVLLFDTAKAADRFSFAAGGTATTSAGTLTVKTSGVSPITISGKPDLSWTGVFAADRFTSVFLRDIGTLTSDFEALLDGSLPQFFAACFALLLLCAASLALLRVTRWPLANIMLLVIAMRGYFSLYHLLAVDLAPRVAAAITDRLVARMLPSAAMAALGVLLLLVDILFIPGNRWSREKDA